MQNWNPSSMAWGYQRSFSRMVSRRRELQSQRCLLEGWRSHRRFQRFPNWFTYKWNMQIIWWKHYAWNFSYQRKYDNWVKNHTNDLFWYHFLKALENYFELKILIFNTFLYKNKIKWKKSSNHNYYIQKYIRDPSQAKILPIYRNNKTKCHYQ